jgi:hypothetical protein
MLNFQLNILFCFPVSFLSSFPLYSCRVRTGLRTSFSFTYHISVLISLNDSCIGHSKQTSHATLNWFIVLD